MNVCRWFLPCNVSVQHIACSKNTRAKFVCFMNKMKPLFILGTGILHIWFYSRSSIKRQTGWVTLSLVAVRCDHYWTLWPMLTILEGNASAHRTSAGDRQACTSTKWHVLQCRFRSRTNQMDTVMALKRTHIAFVYDCRTVEQLGTSVLIHRNAGNGNRCQGRRLK